MKVKLTIRNQKEANDALCNLMDLDTDKFPFIATFESVTGNRSLAINKLYWLWIAEIRDHIKDVSGRIYVADAIHEMLKEMFLEPIVYEFRGKVIKKHSSKVLNNKDFSTYLNNIDMYSANDLNLLLKKPDDIYNEAMGRK